MSDETRVEKAKFELGAPESALAALDPAELAWSYGEDRVTAMVRDPDSAYLYWEITDDGIAAARARLGEAGQKGWINLRVYDTTGRAFDGTNANDYFDIGIDRADREYYLMMGRPTSSMHAEVGVKTHEGFFQPIARSGRVDFPRNTPSPDGSVEWMTVQDEGAPPCVAPYVTRYAGPESQAPTPSSPGGREGARGAAGVTESARSAAEGHEAPFRFSGASERIGASIRGGASERPQQSPGERWAGRLEKSGDR